MQMQDAAAAFRSYKQTDEFTLCREEAEHGRKNDDDALWRVFLAGYAAGLTALNHVNGGVDH